MGALVPVSSVRGMSKQVTTRWYIGAWTVYVVALLGLIVAGRSALEHGLPANGVLLGYLVLLVSGMAMLVLWIAVLIRLGTQQEWGWFVGVVILHLVGLGIVGMVAYATSGPEDAELVVTRPSTPVPG
jgi:hypothetical protein